MGDDLSQKNAPAKSDAGTVGDTIESEKKQRAEQEAETAAPAIDPAILKRPMYGDLSAQRISESQKAGSSEPVFLERKPYVEAPKAKLEEGEQAGPKPDRLAGARHETSVELLAHDLQQKTAKSLQQAAEEAANPTPKAPQPKASDFLHNDSMPIKPLRTFQGDISDAMEHQKSSLIQIKMASVEREPQESKIPEKAANAGIRAVTVILSVLLVLVGITVFIVFNYFSILSRPNTGAPAWNSAMPYDAHEEIDATAARRDAIIQAFAAERAAPQLNAEAIKYLRFTTLGATGRRELTTGEFLGLLDTDMPAMLERSFGDLYMAGAYATTERMEPFIIVSIASFENAYSGMLEWEDNLPRDIVPLFSAKQISRSGTQASGETTSATRGNVLGSPFEDLLIRNIDTRAIRSVDGEVIMLYSFLDRQTLLITSNERAFRGIVDKFIASKLIR